jgi:hypothetical protein
MINLTWPGMVLPLAGNLLVDKAITKKRLT